MRRTLRVVGWTFAVPTAVSLGALALVLGWRDRLPDPVATHWGPDGVDELGSLTPAAVWPLGVVIPAFTLVLAAAAAFLPLTRAHVRGLAASAAGFSVMISGVVTGGFSLQLDLADATTAPDIGGPFALSLLAAIAAAGLAAWLVPPPAETG